METSFTASPAALPTGTRVGPWRVVAWRGQGRYGALYRVEHAEGAVPGIFALKLALTPGDARFEREGELLSRLHHPNIPRLQDRGEWTGPGGALFPYLIMEWVEGLPLYAWAREHLRTSRQAMQVLAQVARALQAVHEAGGIHRDVKGDNILVRAEDGRTVLTDFGSCIYFGASTLTRRLPPPGTPQYSSPESQRFQWRFRRQATARYEARPADDLYALGITAYRLVTGRYPPDNRQLEETVAPDDTLLFPELVPPEELVSLIPELARWIRQLLSESPSARGSAEEVAQALEHAVRRAGREVDRPIAPRTSSDCAAREVPAEPARDRLRWRLWTAAIAVGVALIGSFCAGRHIWPAASSVALVERGERASASVEGGERAGLADTGMAEVETLSKPGPVRNGLGLDMPKKPLPGQRQRPCEPPEVEINDGCWWFVGNAKPPCGKRAYAWKGACYSPSIELPRPPTSDQP